MMMRNLVRQTSTLFQRRSLTVGTSKPAAPPGSKGKLVLLYSGGLDTSTLLKWLLEEGYDVLPMCANIGQYGENFENARIKAKTIGASKVFIEDIRKDFVENFIFPSIQANGIYEDRYLLGTSLARYPIAKRAIELAVQEGAVAVAHGATGKGNDQVRFELTFNSLAPHLQVVVPWRDPAFFTKFEGREALLEYARVKNIPVTQTKKKPYSTDENLLHISYESGVLEDPWAAPPADMFVMTKDPKNAKAEPESLTVSFKKGIPVKVVNDSTGDKAEDSIGVMNLLNEMGMRHGVGRRDIVENRYVGMKSRGVYETPGGTILREAHLDIEGLTVDREVRKLRDLMSMKFAELAYNGYWYSPEMEFVLHSIQKSQENVTGDVKLELYRGNVTCKGRRAPFSLYDEKVASMNVAGGYDPRNAEGFIRINALRLKTYQAVKQKIKNAGGK
jgi:argininosuccinate synthase